MFKNIQFILLTLVIVSCKSIAVQDRYQQTTKQKMAIGSIGLNSNFILEQGYDNTGLPNYDKEIKVSIKSLPYNKATYNAFSKAAQLQEANFKVNYIDSTEIKPRYIDISIADKVLLIESLNANSNITIKNYLSTQREAKIVTSIAMALPSPLNNSIREGDEYFLSEYGKKSYAIAIYRKGMLIETIPFTDGVIFAYDVSSCCWQENDKHQIAIVDLVDNSDCPYKTHASAKRAKKKINYFKF